MPIIVARSLKYRDAARPAFGLRHGASNYNDAITAAHIAERLSDLLASLFGLSPSTVAE
jgi:hypothetical protein